MLPTSTTDAYRLVLPSTVEEGLQRVWAAGLCLNDEETSRVLHLARPERSTPSPVQAVWLVCDTTGRDVAMAMVSDPADDSGEFPVLNLYVLPDHQGLGLGRALIQTVLHRYQDQQLAAYYTRDSVRLYREAGLIPAEVHYSEDAGERLESGDLRGARNAHVAQVLAEREEQDRQASRHRHRMPFG